ncbi:MAG: ABC transporter ATP-binding protein/permease [Candidatus Sumerlaeaceae bacterium]|nr:ABC transporter ATP-binding protein/permease [Candidatus Sumerlaeaceae bacterium]
MPNHHAERSGTVRAASSSPATKKPTDWSQAWGEARYLIWRNRRRIFIGMILMLIGRFASLVLPATTKFLVDNVITGKQKGLLPWLAAAAGLATLVQAVCTFLNSQVLGVAAQRAITEMRKQVMHHVARLPVRYFDSTQTGVLISRVMSDAEGVRNLVGTGLAQLAGSIVTAILALGILFYLNWHLTLATLLVLAIYGGVLSVVFKRLRPVFRERGAINAEVTGRLGETIGGIRIVKAYTAEKREEIVFAKGAHKLFRNVAKAVTGVSGVTAFSIFITGVVAVVMMTVGGNAILAGRMSLGDFVMYIFFTGLLAAPVVQISSLGTQISEAFAGLDRIREIRQMATEDESDAGFPEIGELKGDVGFRDVWFEYDEGVPVLKGISFEAPAGTTTALVGSSGSGKSTLIGLVMGFNRPKSGQVMVDGRDLGAIRRREYRSHLAVVLQDNFLFDGTIADNIRFAVPHATMEMVEEAGRIAHCDEFVKGFEKGYHTVVGERGVKLSGGQRQRVAIARAILAQPRILILDEATSSLDSESEAMIQDGLNALRHQRTTFVIAHRLSTIRSADQILVLEHGEIVERGTHDELLAIAGRYKDLYDRQYQLELNRFINPGEDFTPEPPKVEMPKRGGRGSNL